MNANRNLLRNDRLRSPTIRFFLLLVDNNQAGRECLSIEEISKIAFNRKAEKEMKKAIAILVEEGYLSFSVHNELEDHVIISLVAHLPPLDREEREMCENGMIETLISKNLNTKLC